MGQGQILGLQSAMLSVIFSNEKIRRCWWCNLERTESGLMCSVCGVCVCVSLSSLSLVCMPTFSGHPQDSCPLVCLCALPLIIFCNCKKWDSFLFAGLLPHVLGGAGDEGGLETTCLMVPGHHFFPLKSYPFLLPLLTFASYSFQPSFYYHNGIGPH